MARVLYQYALTHWDRFPGFKRRRGWRSLRQVAKCCLIGFNTCNTYWCSNAFPKFRPQSIQKSDMQEPHSKSWPVTDSSSWPTSHNVEVSIRAYWNSLCTAAAIQTQDVDPVPLQCSATAPDLYKRISKYYIWLKKCTLILGELYVWCDLLKPHPAQKEYTFAVLNFDNNY